MMRSTAARHPEAACWSLLTTDADGEIGHALGLEHPHEAGLPVDLHTDECLDAEILARVANLGAPLHREAQSAHIEAPVTGSLICVPILTGDECLGAPGCDPIVKDILKVPPTVASM